jgi:glycosyltransferase involved in cell wall biosynthesis
VTNNDFKKQLINLGVKNEIFIVPNAAPDSFFELGRKNRKLIRPLTIGFAGKSTSSGNDNDLDIALRLLRRFPSVAKDFHFNFVGCEKSFVERVTNMFSDGLIPEGSISVMEHLSNDELLQAISKFDLAIIPYPDNEYYERSFPIKIVEMMAAGIPMLSSQTKAHIRILGDSYKLFFEAGSEESLKKLLDLVVADEQLISTERQKFAGLSKEFTYSRKVDLIENIRSA